nr:hypothetical protein CFP56_22196 [Quercus suber]
MAARKRLYEISSSACSSLVSMRNAADTLDSAVLNMIPEVRPRHFDLLAIAGWIAVHVEDRVATIPVARILERHRTWHATRTWGMVREQSRLLFPVSCLLLATFSFSLTSPKDSPYWSCSWFSNRVRCSTLDVHDPHREEKS